MSIADNFSLIDSLLPPHREKVLQRLPSDIPIHVTANVVADEEYWKRCCKGMCVRLAQFAAHSASPSHDRARCSGMPSIAVPF